jgi:hypothetical protein
MVTATLREVAMEETEMECVPNTFLPFNDPNELMLV